MTDELTPEIDEVFAKAYAYLMRRRHIRLARIAQQLEQTTTQMSQDVLQQNVVADDVHTHETA